MVSEPALPTWTNTSKGSPPGVSFTVTKAVPIGVSIRYVVAGQAVRPRLDHALARGERRRRGRRRARTPTLRTWLPLHPSRKTVIPRQPSCHASR